MVHLCDNVMNKPTYICSCCGCCCKVLRGINEQEIFAAHPSNFKPEINSEECLGCGLCSDKCQIKAITMSDQGNAIVPTVNYEICIGCGVCSSACPSDALTMTRRDVQLIPPENGREKLKRMANEKGR